MNEFTDGKHFEGCPAPRKFGKCCCDITPPPAGCLRDDQPRSGVPRVPRGRGVGLGVSSAPFILTTVGAELPVSPGSGEDTCPSWGLLGPQPFPFLAEVTNTAGRPLAGQQCQRQPSGLGQATAHLGVASSTVGGLLAIPYGRGLTMDRLPREEGLALSFASCDCDCEPWRSSGVSGPQVTHPLNGGHGGASSCICRAVFLRRLLPLPW